MNMSYCRFHNTEIDLTDCIEALENRDIGSEEEKQKARYMLNNFLQFALNEGIIDDYKHDEIERIISECEDQEED